LASYTPNLDLLKKNPLTEGSDTFNITTMLNDNWDKIDSKIGNPAELWVWEKRTVNSEAIPAHTIETTKTDYVYQKKGGSANKYYEMTIIYGDSISVSSDGSVTINNANTTTQWPANLASYWSTYFVGKYIQITGTTYDTDTYFSTMNKNVLYIPSSVSDYDNPYTTFREITGVADVPADITVEYLSSPNPSAYPDSQTVGNVTITKLERIGEGLVRFEAGKYTGTGTYGSSNPITINFSFVPKVVFITSDDAGSGPAILFPSYGQGQSFGTGYGVAASFTYLLLVNVNGNAVSFYNSTANSTYGPGAQCNVLSKHYSYIAIG